MKRSITDFLNTEVKEYAISVVEERAIPSVIDGFKPVQRKIVFTADKVARQPIKTAALIGNVISIGGYYKGDVSIAFAASKMAQDFTGSNNFPWLSGKGEFGKRLTPQGVAAPRYTKCSLHKNFDRFFTDKELLTYDEQDGEFFEPRYYLPVIPTVLTNGVSGIAVGFACEILPYNVADIIENVKLALTRKPLKPMTPYFEGFKGTITPNGEPNRWVMTGKYKKVNSTTIEIYELPVGTSRDSYVEHLNKLEDKGTIRSYEDHCKKDFKFIIYMTRKDLAKMEKNKRVETVFKLQKKLSQNINVISENGKLINFETPEQLIEYFVNFRMGIMTKRKEYYAQYYAEKLSYAAAKGMFINQVLTNKFNLRAAKSKADLVERISKLGKAFKPHSDRLSGIPIYHFTKEEIAKLKEECKNYQAQQKYFETVGEKKLFENDVLELINNLKRG